MSFAHSNLFRFFIFSFKFIIEYAHKKNCVDVIEFGGNLQPKKNVPIDQFSLMTLQLSHEFIDN